MANTLSEMASDLSKLLSEVKVKPVIVAENKTPPVDTAKLASEITALVFKTAPLGSSPSLVAEALIHASTVKATEHKLSAKEVFEATIDYCIKMVESAQNKLDLVE